MGKGDKVMIPGADRIRSGLLKTLHDRGFIYQATDLDALDHQMNQGPIVVYVGFDASAPSLHVGSLVQIMLLRWLRRYGHKVLVLVGGATTRVGDPTGKEESRPLLDESDITHNTQRIQQILLSFLGATNDDVVMLDNYTWLQHITYLDTLRLYGRHLSVNRMLSFDSIKQRLGREQHLSFLEFNYMVLQAIDFIELHKKYGCILQMGGADQWGNIVCGVELGRKMGLSPLFGLTTPLLLTAQGHKMGKTASGAVWLSNDRLSPYDYWQFWRNTHDADVGRFLRLFTDLPLAEIQNLESREGAQLAKAKVTLADEATKLCHGNDVLDDIHRRAGQFFKNQEVGIDQAGTGLCSPPMVPDAELLDTQLVSETLHQLGWVSSKSEARRLIRQGGVRMNDRVIQDEMAFLRDCLEPSDLSLVTLSKGKKHALLHITSHPSSC